jgi:hypothetical protein
MKAFLAFILLASLAFNAKAASKTDVNRKKVAEQVLDRAGYNPFNLVVYFNNFNTLMWKNDAGKIASLFSEKAKKDLEIKYEITFSSVATGERIDYECLVSAQPMQKKAKIGPCVLYIETNALIENASFD